MKTILTLLLLFWVGPSLHSQIVFMVPDGQHDSLQQYRQVLPDDPQYTRMNERFSGSPFLDMSALYRYVQVYLVNQGKLDSIHPIYLALTDNQGGFPRQGFALNRAGNVFLLPEVDYIDLHHNILDENRYKRGGYILNHELGHIILGKLSGGYESNAASIHYFSIVTEYTTAFNEGFGEHFESSSIDMEEDIAVRNAVMADYPTLYESVKHMCNGYERDYRWPFRMDFYRASALFWYTKLEDYKRNQYVVNHLAKYYPATRDLRNTWSAIQYRNTAVSYDPAALRTPEQACSTEGVVADFFTALVRSDLRLNRPDSVFFSRFSLDPSASEKISPIMNQYLKIVHVMGSYVKMENKSIAPIAAFMEGYFTEFPEEREEVMRLWEQASGHRYTGKPANEIWIEVDEASHSPVAIIQFGIRTSSYSFNLNTADRYDLLTVKGVMKEDADKIIAYRSAKGFFIDREELKRVPGLSKTAVEALLESRVRVQPEGEGSLELSVNKILAGSVTHVVGIAGLWLIAGLLIIWMLAKGLKIRFDLKRLARQIGTFLLLFLLATAAVVLTHTPALWFSATAVIVLAFKAIVNRKDRQKMIFSLSAFMVQWAIFLYSVL